MRSPSNARVEDRAGYKAQAKSQIDTIVALVALLLRLAVIIAVVGAVLGLAVGMQVGSTLVGALGDLIQTVTWPWVRLGLFVVFGVLAGMAAVVLPARRAARLDVLTAVRHH